MRFFRWSVTCLILVSSEFCLADVFFRDIPRRKLVVAYSEDDAEGSWTVFKYCRDFRLDESAILRDCQAAEVKAGGAAPISLV